MGHRRWRVVAAALAAVACGAGCGGEEAATMSSPTPPAAAGARPVAFSGRDVATGRDVELASFRGRPTVVAIWASWCPPCQEDGPVFARFAREHPDVAFVGVDYKDGLEAARAFLRAYRWRFRSVADPQGRLAEQRLGMRTMPTTIVLDAEHREVGRLVGATTAAQLERLVERARTLVRRPRG
jgi:thiol-disulfide isomerase/thioredoxin